VDVKAPLGALIEEREHGLALVGDFDLFWAPEVEARIDACAASADACISLDLTNCTYVDSTILTVLVRAANAYEGRLEIIAPRSGNVARIFALTKLDRFLPLV
jgi:anti-anti-sigma factor